MTSPVRSAGSAPSFKFDKLPTNLPTPAKLAVATNAFGDEKPVYIGGGASIVADKATGWGMQNAGTDFMAAVSAAREVASTPFRPWSNITAHETKRGGTTDRIWRLPGFNNLGYRLSIGERNANNG